MNGFAGSEVDRESSPGIGGGNLYSLRNQRLKVHLNAGRGSFPEHLVAEVLDVEVGAEVAIQAGEHVQIECGGGSCGIVIGGQQRRFGLVRTGAKVRAQQQRVARQKLRAEITQDPRASSGVKLPILEPM